MHACPGRAMSPRAKATPADQGLDRRQGAAGHGPIPGPTDRCRLARRAPRGPRPPGRPVARPTARLQQAPRRRARPTATSTRSWRLRGHGPRDGRRRARVAGPDARGDRAPPARWRVGDGDRVVFYDDVGMNRQAIRGYWLLRLYGFPTRSPAHPRRRDRGLAAGRRRDHDRGARGRPGRRPARAGDARRSRRRASSRPTTRSSTGAARRRRRRRPRRGSSTSGRPPSGSARTCAPSAAATSRAPASAASSTC